MFPQPERQHEWLKRFVGEWTFTADCFMGPDQPSSQSTGTENVRMFGDLWVIGEMTTTMPGGGEMRSIMTLGDDVPAQPFQHSAHFRHAPSQDLAQGAWRAQVALCALIDT